MEEISFWKCLCDLLCCRTPKTEKNEEDEDFLEELLDDEDGQQIEDFLPSYM